MNYEIGYHIISDDVFNELPKVEDQLSIVEFLRLVRESERLPMNVTVHGLDNMLTAADETDAICDLIHDVLADGVNHLTREQPVIRFVVNEVEYWDEPVIRCHDEHIPLTRIFSGGMTQEGADWFFCRLNVTS